VPGESREPWGSAEAQGRAASLDWAESLDWVASSGAARREAGHCPFLDSAASSHSSRQHHLAEGSVDSAEHWDESEADWDDLRPPPDWAATSRLDWDGTSPQDWDGTFRPAFRPAFRHRGSSTGEPR
ncbi:MAG: hypothetical protein ACK53V_08740, partial [Planctomycetota bacterium]